MNLIRITLAVTQMDPMVRFYNDILETKLEPINGTPFYRGELAGIPIVFCPNEIAGVVAEQNRHQLKFSVDSISAMRDKVATFGGQILDQSELGFTVIDPDGNTIELTG